MTRRHWMAVAGAAAWGTPFALRADAPAAKLRRAWVRLRTSREALARALPPPLTASETADLWVEFWSAESAEAADLRTPADRSGCRVFAAVEYQGTAGLYPLGLWTSHEWGRWEAREGGGWNLKDGHAALRRENGQLEAALERRGTTLCRLRFRETEPEEEAGTQLSHPNLPVFFFRGAWAADWTAAILEGGVELCRLDPLPFPAPQRAVLAGKDSTVFAWQTASALDPVAEFPVEEISAAGYQEFSAIPAWKQGGVEVLEEMPREEFAPWAPVLSERPLAGGRVWIPAGWREEATAYRFSADEMERYRAREEIALGAADFAEVEVLIDREMHAALLPPPCRATLRPSLKVMALRVNESDADAAPFQEVWLFALCLLRNRPVWYAVSHLAGAGADLIRGRETLGYPTREADVNVVVSPANFSLLARRNGRDVVFGGGGFRGFATGTSLMQMEIASLRVAGPRGTAAAQGELLIQHWYFQGRRQQVDPVTVSLEFPQPSGSGGAGTDPWHEFPPLQLLSAGVFDRGSMQRMPPERVAVVDDPAPYYRERCDGRLPWEPAESGQTPSFERLADPQSRS